MYNREMEVKAFDETKAGVKGLVDAGVTKIPRMFIHNHQNNQPPQLNSNLKIPIIDLQGLDNDKTRAEIIEKVGGACEEWGFFQLVNHGIPTSLLDEVIDGIRKFHEQDLEVKKKHFSRDYSRKVLYHTNYDLYQAQATCWRDTLTFIMAPCPPPPENLPLACSNTNSEDIIYKSATRYRTLEPTIFAGFRDYIKIERLNCRDVMIRYTEEIMNLGIKLYEVLSEALGLNRNHLKDMGCAEGLFVPCHYYPACPEPEFTMGLRAHADTGFITLLLQDQIGGLQVLYNNQWVDVDPIPGALVFNVGDLLKLVSNDRFVSAYHRVVNKKLGPRISVPYIFRTHLDPENTSRLYGPIQELLSEANPPRYREITVKELISPKFSRGSKGIGALEQFKL